MRRQLEQQNRKSRIHKTLRWTSASGKAWIGMTRASGNLQKPVTPSPRGKNVNIFQTKRGGFFEEPTRQIVGIEFFHCNLNGFATHAVRVVAAIRLRQNKPHVVFLNETKTDQADKSFNLEGYVLVYRGDRCKGGGGIAVLARHSCTSYSSRGESR